MSARGPLQRAGLSRKTVVGDELASGESLADEARARQPDRPPLGEEPRAGAELEPVDDDGERAEQDERRDPERAAAGGEDQEEEADDERDRAQHQQAERADEPGRPPAPVGRLALEAAPLAGRPVLGADRQPAPGAG